MKAMKTLNIEPTPTSPAVLFDKGAGLFQVTGKCYPSDVIAFFDPILFWIKAYFQDPNPITEFDFKLKYISSNSLKQLLIILKNLVPFKESHQIVVNWYRFPEDDDMQERGEFLMETTGLLFNFLDMEESA